MKGKKGSKKTKRKAEVKLTERKKSNVYEQIKELEGIKHEPNREERN